MVLGLLAKTFWARTLKSGVHMQASVMKMPLTLYIPTITSSLVTSRKSRNRKKGSLWTDASPKRLYGIKQGYKGLFFIL